MREHSFGTTKQERLRQAEEIQLEVNHTLEELQGEITAANLTLAEMYENESELIGDYVQDLIEYLDDKWGHNDDYFMVSGRWLEPQLGMNEEGVLVRHREADAFNVVRSNGFLTCMVGGEDNEVPQVGMSFIVGNVIPVSTPLIQGQFEPLAFAAPSEISVQYLRPGGVSTVSDEPSDMLEAIMQADAVLNVYTNSRDSSFYRQRAGKQEKFFKSLIASVEEVLPAPDSLDNLYITDAETDVLYYTDPASNNLQIIQTADITPFIINAKVLGVTLADIVAYGYGEHYESPDDLGASEDGLCLIVRPVELSQDLEQLEGLDLLIPIRGITELDMVVQ